VTVLLGTKTFVLVTYSWLLETTCGSTNRCNVHGVHVLFKATNNVTFAHCEPFYEGIPYVSRSRTLV